MNISAFYDSPMSDDERRERVYQGDLFIFSPTPASRDLIALARDMLTQALAIELKKIQPWILIRGGRVADGQLLERKDAVVWIGRNPVAAHQIGCAVGCAG